MGWRNNLSHARYYARKERELEELKNEDLFINTFQSKTNSCTSSTNSISPKFTNNNEINNLYSKQNFVSNKNSPQSPPKQQRTLSIDNSASDFQSTIPLFPAQFNIPPPSLPPPSCLIDPTIDNNTGMARPASFFFIPSQTSTFVPIPPAITSFNPTENLGMFSSPPPSFKFIPPNFYKENNSLNNTNRNINVAEYGVSEFELLQAKIKTTPNLFREEIQIRNSDSGKG
uniref:Uncharacterized protein n=1 Tax=Meloidogyne incognita TaxID=6306 RepID=A0A914NLI6_MELIC